MFILLHGAGLGAWIWDDVLPLLDGPARALDLPGRGDGANPGDVTLEQCVAYVAAQLEAGTVLVAHSFSAEVAVAVATRHPEKVKALVFVGGVVPESGKNFLSLLPLPMRLFLRVVIGRSKNGVAIPPGQVRKGYCNDLDDFTCTRVVQKITREVPRLYLDPVTWSLPSSLPRVYVKLLEDAGFKSAEQDKMIARLGATKVETLPTGHLPMLGKPDALAAILNRV